MARTAERRASTDPQRDGTPVVVRTCLHSGPPPPPGFLPEPFAWEDVLRTDPPPKAAAGERSLVLLGGEETDAETAVAEAVVVRVLAVDGAAIIDVHAALYVEPRTLAAAIAVEERVVGVAIEKARADTDEALAAREEAVPGPLKYVVKAERKVWSGLFGGLRGITTGAVTFPDRFRRRWGAAASFLAERENRRRFWRGLVRPQELTREQKAITLFVALTSVVAFLLLTHVVVTLAVPDVARDWRAIFFLFSYAIVTAVGIPLPIEPALVPAALVIGPPAAIAVTVAAKVTGAWMVFFLGDEVNGTLERRAATDPRFARFLRASERFAHRFGLFAVAAFLTVPGLPDAIALYVFGSLGMSLGRFLLGVAIGGTILYTTVLYGILHLFGLG